MGGVILLVRSAQRRVGVLVRRVSAKPPGVAVDLLLGRLDRCRDGDPRGPVGQRRAFYSLRYFDAAGPLFGALMLVFLAAMVGFCLTGDLFDLAVFFELMGVAAYALTAYKIEEAARFRARSTSRSQTASARLRC